MLVGQSSGEPIHSLNLGLLFEETDPVQAVALISIYVDYGQEIGGPAVEAIAEKMIQIQTRLRNFELP